MQKKSFDVPAMYGDHHVSDVRRILLEIPGVEEVYASSAFKRVVVSYDPARLNPSVIEENLRAAGYGPGDDWELPSPPEGKDDNSPWFKLVQRITKTNMLDLQMSGDFRKY